MKHSVFLNNIKSIRLIIIFCCFVSVAGAFLFRSYFSEEQNASNNFFNPDEVMISLMIDGKKASEFPTRDSGKVFMSANCDKGASAVWNYSLWGPLILNATKARTKCQFEFVSKYSDSALNGADPVVKDGLIPVTIDESGVVKKANLGSEWYNYEKKNWANAVTLIDGAKEYVEDEIIPEENIESYFVWIPRYRYKIFNDGNYEGITSVENKVQTIEIEFENKEKGISNGSRVGEWMTHPAFTSFDVNGIWVGKFETGFKGAKDSIAAQSDTFNSGNIVIKPNTYSWRGLKVSNAFVASYNYRRSMDSHMMKNTEWGTVAFLQHSKYGSQVRVRINNNSAYITGYAAKNESTCGYTGTNEECNKYESTDPGLDGTYTVNYKNNASIVASTTGNRSGIYDMSGGAWEYVMGVMQDKSGNPVSGRNDGNHSNFVGTLTYPNDGTNKSKTSWTSADGGISFPDSIYYDKYTYGEDDVHYNRRILGDATGEMGPFANVTYGSQTTKIGSWYANSAWYVWPRAPWFTRGYNFDGGLNGNIFSFQREGGRAASWLGFRIVLAF